MLQPVSVVALVCAIALAGCSFGPEQKLEQLQGPVFGTSYHIKVVLTPEGPGRENIQSAVQETLESVDASMSTWRDDSELSRFNAQSGSERWFSVSKPLFDVLSEGQRIARETEGAFDMTIGPVVNLWGFGPKGRPEEVPDTKRLASVLENTGYEFVELQSEPPAIRAESPQYVDLSAIAKGYAVDAVSRRLKSMGIEQFLVEIGGEIRVNGRKPSGKPWRLAVERPHESGRSVQEVVEMTDGAIATSGDYRNYYEADGKRYSHTINPKTGRPIRHRLASVSVITDSAMTADALATALMVMGEERGYAFAERRDLAAYFIYRDGVRFQVQSTSAFESRKIR